MLQKQWLQLKMTFFLGHNFLLKVREELTFDGERIEIWWGKFFQVSLHGKPYFLFPDVLKRWSFQENSAGIWSFLYYWKRWYFFFPKIWSYTLDGKWKMIFLKKHAEIWYFLQAFWKDGLSRRGRAGTWSFLFYLERWYFFPKTWSFYPGQKVKDGSSREIHENMMHRPVKKNRKPDIQGWSLASP